MKIHDELYCEHVLFGKNNEQHFAYHWASAKRAIMKRVQEREKALWFSGCRTSSERLLEVSLCYCGSA